MSLWTLLMLKLRLTKNRYLHLGWVRLLAYVAFLVFAGMLALGLFRLLVALMHFMPAEAATALLSGSLSAAMTFVVFWGMGTVLNLFYLSSDLELLLVVPLKRRSVFAIKLIETTMAMLIPAALALAILWSYGAANGSPWSYYVVAVLILVATVLFAVLIAALLILWVMRFLPARRAQELWTVFWTLGFGLIWAGWMLLSNSSVDPQQVAGSVAATSMRAGHWLQWAPAGWAARIATSWVVGDWGLVALNAAILIGAVVVLYLAGQWTFERVFYEGWSRMQSRPTRKRQAAQREDGATPSLWVRLVPQQIRALAIKDWLTLFRDPGRLSRLISPFLFGVVYTYLIMRDTGSIGASIYWIAAALAPLVGFFFGLYLSTVAISAEGMQLALLRTLPIKGSHLLWSKFIYSWVPVFVLGELAGLATVIVVTGSTAGLLSVAILLFWVSLGLCVLGVALGALFPQLRRNTGRRAGSTLASYGYLLIGAALCLVSFGGLVGVRVLLDARSPSVVALVEGLPWIGHVMAGIWLPVGIVVANIAIWGVLVVLWHLAARRLDGLQFTDLERAQ